MLQILQTEIFQFALQFIETQFVGEWGIEVTGFLADFLFCLFLLRVSYLSHHIHAVCYHDEDHTHVFRKRDEQISEILAFYDRISFVQIVNAEQTADDVLHVVTIFAFDVC